VVTVTDPVKKIAEMIMTRFEDESKECANRWIAEVMVRHPELDQDFRDMCNIAFRSGYMAAIRNHFPGR
jgi:hypothetical protein